MKIKTGLYILDPDNVLFVFESSFADTPTHQHVQPQPFLFTNSYKISHI